MSELATLHRYDLGEVSVYTDGRPGSPTKPVVAMFHGALRDSTALSRWPPLLQDVADVMLFDLPGHGRSAEIADPTILRMASQLAPFVRRYTEHRPAVLLAGESIGALVALGLHRMVQGPAPVGLLLADPPMSTAKLWSIQAGWRRLWESGDITPQMAAISRSVLGFSPEGLTDILYYDLFRDLQVPTTIVASDVPLFPQRTLIQSTHAFDAVDQYVVGEITHGRAQFRQARNSGHLVLIEDDLACREIAVEMLSALMAPAEGRD
jgi:hypothetical protein